MKPISVLRFLTLILVPTSLACAPKQNSKTHGPLVIFIPGRLAREGSFEECVYQKVQGGMKLADALTSCAKLSPPDLYGTGLEPLDLMDGGTGVALSDCYGDWNRNAPLEATDAFNAARDAARRVAMFKALREFFLDELSSESDPDKRKTLRKGVNEMNQAANEASHEYEDILDQLSDEEKALVSSMYNYSDLSLVDELRRPARPTPAPTPPGDYVPPDPNTGIATPMLDSPSLCQQLTEFIGSCNENGWNSPECMKFMDGMKGCLDRTVADPADPAEPCSLPRVDPETVREVMLLQCEALRHPMPGEDPCTNGIKGEAFEYAFRTGAGNLDPCNNPYVRQTGEDCYPTFTLVRFEEPNIRDLMKQGLIKFGGPAFVIPTGPPEPDPVNPLPKRPDDH